MLSVRQMRLNRGGEPDPLNTLTATPSDVTDFDITHRRRFDYVELDIGVGAERREISAGNNDTSLRVHVAVTVRL